MLESLECIVLTFLEQVCTSEIELALVSRLKAKENGYDYHAATCLSSLEMVRLVLILIESYVGRRGRGKAASGASVLNLTFAPIA